MSAIVACIVEELTLPLKRNNGSFNLGCKHACESSIKTIKTTSKSKAGTFGHGVRVCTLYVGVRIFNTHETQPKRLIHVNFTQMQVFHHLNDCL